MDLSKDTLFKLVDELTSYEDIKLSDIPCIDLYMDQVTTFFDDKLKSFKRDEDEKILTKTMINNYAKAKLLLPVKSKKYSKEQIVLLALIYNLKQSLSINDIGLVLSPVLKSLSLEDNVLSLDSIYTEFLHINKLQAEEFNSWFKEKIEFLSSEINNTSASNNDAMLHLLTVLMLINSANTQKRMAEKIIDNFFSNKKEK
jgi:hypothetical protein